jgi:hypothetical protein
MIRSGGSCPPAGHLGQSSAVMLEVLPERFEFAVTACALPLVLRGFSARAFIGKFAFQSRNSSFDVFVVACIVLGHVQFPFNPFR